MIRCKNLPIMQRNLALSFHRYAEHAVRITLLLTVEKDWARLLRIRREARLALPIAMAERVGFEISPQRHFNSLVGHGEPLCRLEGRYGTLNGP